MATDRLVLSLCCALSLLGCAEDPAPEVTDASWDELSQAQRRAHLEEKIAESLETLENTGDGPTWHEASEEAMRALSLLRAEGGLQDREGYMALETEVERLTNEPPFFAQ